MNTPDSVKLTSPDVIHFRGKMVTVRLYKRQKWYAGFCWKIGFDGNSSYIWLDPFVRIGLGHNTAPCQPGDCLFDTKDWALPDSLRTNERPFNLVGCTHRKIEGPPSDLIIVSFTEGTLILSQREIDKESARSIFHITPSYGLELEQ